jgi:hypothetical protein
VIAIVLVGATATAVASPTGDLEKAALSFRAKDYDSTSKTVGALLYPREQLATPEDIVLAHILLGASFFELGRRDDAKVEFERALALEPQKTLDTLLFSKGAVRLFDDTKDDIGARAKRDDELRKLQEERERIRQQLANRRDFEVHEYYVNFIPFGAGQFQDHRTAAGVAFATSEALTVAGYITIVAYLTNKYPIVCPPVGVSGPCTRPVPLNEIKSAGLLQGIGYGTLGGFALLYAINVWDSIRHFKPRVQVNVSPELLKELEKQKPKTPKKTSLLDRIHVVPMATPNGFGVGLGWEN